MVNSSTESITGSALLATASLPSNTSVTNAEFLAAVFRKLPDGASAAVCSKAGDPEHGGWPASLAESSINTLLPSHNNYINCSSFRVPEDGTFNVRKENFSACHFLMLDDLGTKVPLDRLAGFELSWMIETSPGNHQGGIILAKPLTDGMEATSLLDAIIDAGLCDKGASGPLSRWARLPNAINGKPKYAAADGTPFQCRLVEWRPDRCYTPEQIVGGLKLNLTSPKQQSQPADTRTNHSDEVWQPRAEENPVIAALKARGLYKTPLGSGKHDITCPWVQEHTDALDTGAAYFEPDELYPVGGFCCQHSHREKYHIRQLLEFLGVRNAEAKHKAAIRVIAGDLHRVVDAAERELAKRRRHYQYGGMIASVTTHPATGDPTIVPINSQVLTKELSYAAAWEKFDGRTKEWAPCDPPARHVGILYDTQEYRYLPVLAGVVRQPYFREVDGELVMEAGYDSVSHLFGVFDAREFVIPEPTLEAAQQALAMLRELLAEFPFAEPTDEAAALSAFFTAVVRQSVSYAPGFHVRAPVFGSGKTFLCELIGAFAGPGVNAKVSYPTTSEEATKVILSLLMTNPAVIEFDDMDTDWIAHGVIKRMLTADKITDRILGYSKTATVSTRTLFLGSGNNVGPVRDLLRRIVTINLDPRCATPATTVYKGKPVELVHNNRGKYVAAVLTIILTWRKSGMPRAAVDSIATYGGAWADYCRHPLMWLGLPDPAASLLEQVKHDPEGDALLGLILAWKAQFGSTPTTVRKAVAHAISDQLGSADLLDAMREFPVEERGEINRSKLGWLLKKNANRTVGGYAFEQCSADGRVAWRVIQVTPPSPPSAGPIAKTVDGVGGQSDGGDHGIF